MGILRWLLAVVVLTGHSSPIFGIKINAIFAVKIFYMISGFYMALVLSTKYAAKNSLKSFYINRALRIYPIYFIVLAITLFYFFEDYVNHAKELHWTAILMVVFANLFIFGQDLLYVMHQTPQGHFLPGPTHRLDIHTFPPRFSIIGPAWTLGLECTFYLFVPFIMRSRLPIILGLLFGFLFIRNLCIHHVCGNGLYTEWFYRFFPFELPLFLSGTIAYFIFTKISHSHRLLIIYLLLFPVYVKLVHKHDFCGLKVPYIYILYFVPLLFYITRESKIDHFIGSFSYPMYISHFFCMFLIYKLGLDRYIPLIGRGMLLLIVTSLFCFPLIFIDKYLDKWRRPSRMQEVSTNDGPTNIRFVPVVQDQVGT